MQFSQRLFFQLFFIFFHNQFSTIYIFFAFKKIKLFFYGNFLIFISSFQQNIIFFAFRKKFFDNYKILSDRKVYMVSKSGSKTDCPKGMIKRKAFTRKSNGKTIKVPAACVEAQGKAKLRGSKTPKAERVLPDMDQLIHLREFGYSTKVSADKRHKALLAASKKIGDLK